MSRTGKDPGYETEWAWAKPSKPRPGELRPLYDGGEYSDSEGRNTEFRMPNTRRRRRTKHRPSEWEGGDGPKPLPPPQPQLPPQPAPAFQPPPPQVVVVPVGAGYYPPPSASVAPQAPFQVPQTSLQQASQQIQHSQPVPPSPPFPQRCYGCCSACRSTANGSSGAERDILASRVEILLHQSKRLGECATKMEQSLLFHRRLFTLFAVVLAVVVVGWACSRFQNRAPSQESANLRYRFLDDNEQPSEARRKPRSPPSQ
jgi:hypothetical protein